MTSNYNEFLQRELLESICTKIRAISTTLNLLNTYLDNHEEDWNVLTVKLSDLTNAIINNDNLLIKQLQKLNTSIVDGFDRRCTSIEGLMDRCTVTTKTLLAIRGIIQRPEDDHTWKMLSERERRLELAAYTERLEKKIEALRALKAKKQIQEQRAMVGVPGSTEAQGSHLG